MTDLINLGVTSELIKKYNRPGPRYTSYPTVPVWNEGDFSLNYSNCLREEGQKNRPISMYIHIPFCKKLCTFCGCNKFITNNQHLVEKYLIALEHEIQFISDLLGKSKKIAEIHLGGGTPTFLKPQQLSRLVEIIFSNFDSSGEKEWSFEADPRVTTNEHLEILYELGFRRVSFGVQDLNTTIQQAINRNQTKEQSWHTLNLARSLGYKSINLDLVYGLPLQTHKIFRNTLDEVVQMRPDRLAVYSFAFLPGMFKTHHRAIKEKDLPSPDEKINIYLESIKFFDDAGYVMIGMDHYALPSDDLAEALKNRTLHRNFMGYTTLHDMVQVGVGVSAISDFGDSYMQNPKDIDQYVQEATEYKLIPRRGCIMNKEDQLRRKIIETLMCQGEIFTNVFEKDFEIDFRKHFTKEWNQLQKLEADRLLTLSSQKIKITNLGRLFMRNVVMPFDRHFENMKTQNFSKTV